MKLNFDFTVSINEEAYMVQHGERWCDAMGESANEFGQELNDWLNKHPFVEGARLAFERKTQGTHDWLILYFGVEEWEPFVGTLDEAVKHAESDHQCFNYGHKGYQIHPAIPIKTVHKPL